MKLKSRSSDSRVRSHRLLLAIACLLPLLALAAPPGWWTDRQVLDPNSAQNDFGPVNQGQLKNMAKKAYAELRNALPSGIWTTSQGQALAALVDSWNPAQTGNFDLINQGQLKAVAKKFYDVLISHGYTNAYPWTGATTAAANYAPANLGQLKNLFSFDLTRDSDGDGIPDWWETKYNLNPFNAADAGQIAIGGGMTNLQHFDGGSNPTLPPPPPIILAGNPTLDLSADTVFYPEDDSQLLIKNGNFSAPVLQTDPLKQWRTLDVNWDFFPGLPPAAPQPHWTPVYGGLVELQKITNVSISGQYCELDADWDEPALAFRSHGIQQTVDLARGHYILIFDYRGRDGDAGSFVVKVKSQGSASAETLVTKNGASTTEWKRAIATFDVTGGNPNLINLPVTLIFDSTDESDGRGAYIDNVILLPVEIEGYKRGTINTPGAKVPKGTGQFGYETVMMENADSESSENSTLRDCDFSEIFKQDIDDHRKERDDDLVKVVLRFPPNIKIAGASLKLLHEGMQVDATQTTPEAAVTAAGPSRMNFYRADGTRIMDPAFDLQIPDLSAPPATAYLSKIVTEGQVTIFIEGGSDFGYLPADRMNRLGGAILKWQFQHGTATTTEKLLVYRGGFVRFLQPRGAPGTVGTFEFWDGKGRVRHRVGSPIFGHEFSGEDDTDYGTRLSPASWKAKSGKPKPRGQAYNIAPEPGVSRGLGHVPPGWWRQWESDKEWTRSQLDAPTGSGPTRKVVQGGYVRWKQDDETDPAKRYMTQYKYDGTTPHDAAAGEPEGIKFKFDMEPIPPANSTIAKAAQNRSDIQIHPDGQCNDPVMGGTAGCIGIQTWEGCNEVFQLFKRYRGLKVKVQLQ